MNNSDAAKNPEDPFEDLNGDADDLNNKQDDKTSGKIPETNQPADRVEKSQSEENLGFNKVKPFDFSPTDKAPVDPAGIQPNALLREEPSEQPTESNDAGLEPQRSLINRSLVIINTPWSIHLLHP